MKKRGSIWLPVIWVCVVLVAGSLLVTTIYLDLRSQSVENREEQLLVLARSAASNLESYLGSYQKDFSVIRASSDFREGTDHFLATGDDTLLLRYLDTYNTATEDYVADISLTDGEGRVLAGTNRHGPYEAITRPGKDLVVSRGPDGLYLAISTPVGEGLRLQSMVDVAYMYQSTGAFMTIGKRGYVFYQHSGGVVLTHPRESFAGQELLEGPGREFPELDPGELPLLRGHQQSGEEGILRYRSRWWDEAEPGEAVKLAAYAPARIGDDFLMVTAVADHREIMELLNRGILLIGAVLSLMMVALCFLTFQLYTAIGEKSRVERENTYLRELNEALEEMRRREEKLQHFQRLEIIGTLTGGIAHELGNLLVPIMAYSALMADQVSPQQEELYDEAQEIYSAARKAKEVIQQITDISRKDRGAFQELDLSLTVGSALKMACSAKPREVEMEWSLTLEDCRVLGSATQLCQVVLNLCTNAFHAVAGRENGFLRVEGHLRPALGEEGEVAVFTFTDNGTGIEPQMQERIFDPFFTTKRTGEGTGLGLSIVQSIAENHRGTVTVESRPGEGSTFTLELPVIKKMAGV